MTKASPCCFRPGCSSQQRGRTCSLPCWKPLTSAAQTFLSLTFQGPPVSGGVTKGCLEPQLKSDILPGLQEPDAFLCPSPPSASKTLQGPFSGGLRSHMTPRPPHQLCPIGCQLLTSLSPAKCSFPTAWGTWGLFHLPELLAQSLERCPVPGTGLRALQGLTYFSQKSLKSIDYILP